MKTCHEDMCLSMCFAFVIAICVSVKAWAAAAFDGVMFLAWLSVFVIGKSGEKTS